MKLKKAEVNDIEVLKSLISQYHRFENIAMSDSTRVKAFSSLIGENQFGRIWLILSSEKVIGYIVLCFGYSIEFRGRDAFIDELYIQKPHRGKGFGRAVLAAIKNEANNLGIKTLHLEVARTNARAKKLYSDMGFRAREGFHLMSCNVN